MKKALLTTAIALIAGLAISLTAMAAIVTTTQTYTGIANYNVVLNITSSTKAFGTNPINVSYASCNNYVVFTDSSKDAMSAINKDAQVGHLSGLPIKYVDRVLGQFAIELTPGTLTQPYASGFTITTSAGNVISIPLIDYDGKGTLTVLSGTYTFGNNTVTYSSTSVNNTITLNVSIQ